MQKVAKGITDATTDVQKAAKEIANKATDNDGKALKNTMDALATNAKAGISSIKNILPADTSTNEFKTVGKLINGDVVATNVKNAAYSAEIFNGQAALDFATGAKSGKNAIDSASAFISNGKTAVEKKLDQAAFKDSLIQKMGPEKYEKFKSQQAQQALKAQLLAKHASKLQ